MFRGLNLVFLQSVGSAVLQVSQDGLAESLSYMSKRHCLLRAYLRSIGIPPFEVSPEDDVTSLILFTLDLSDGGL